MRWRSDPLVRRLLALGLLCGGASFLSPALLELGNELRWGDPFSVTIVLFLGWFVVGILFLLIAALTPRAGRRPRRVSHILGALVSLVFVVPLTAMVAVILVPNGWVAGSLGALAVLSLGAAAFADRLTGGRRWGRFWGPIPWAIGGLLLLWFRFARVADRTHGWDALTWFAVGGLALLVHGMIVDRATRLVLNELPAPHAAATSPIGRVSRRTVGSGGEGKPLGSFSVEAGAGLLRWEAVFTVLSMPLLGVSAPQGEALDLILLRTFGPFLVGSVLVFVSARLGQGEKPDRFLLIATGSFCALLLAPGLLVLAFKPLWSGWSAGGAASMVFVGLSALFLGLGAFHGNRRRRSLRVGLRIRIAVLWGLSSALALGMGSVLGASPLHPGIVVLLSSPLLIGAIIAAQLGGEVATLLSQGFAEPTVPASRESYVFHRLDR